MRGMQIALILAVTLSASLIAGPVYAAKCACSAVCCPGRATCSTSCCTVEGPMITCGEWGMEGCVEMAQPHAASSGLALQLFGPSMSEVAEPALATDSGELTELLAIGD